MPSGAAGGHRPLATLLGHAPLDARRYMVAALVLPAGLLVDVAQKKY